MGPPLTKENLLKIAEFTKNQVVLRRWGEVVDYLINSEQDRYKIKREISKLGLYDDIMDVIVMTLEIWNQEDNGTDLVATFRQLDMNLLANQIQDLNILGSGASVTCTASSWELFLSQRAQELKYDQNAKVSQSADKIYNVIKSTYPNLVHGYQIAGSIGKGTAINVYPGPDLDMVIFVDTKPPFKESIENFKHVLEQSKVFQELRYLPTEDDYEIAYEHEICVERVTRYSLQFKYNELDVDLLLASYYSEDEETQLESTLAEMKRLYESSRSPYFYNTSYCKSIVSYMNDQPEQVLNLIRIVKCWARPGLNDSDGLIGTFPSKSYLLELVSIHAVKNLPATRFQLYESFKNAMHILKNFNSIRIILNQSELGIPEKIRQQRPLLMDPVCRFNNVLARKNDLMSRRRHEVENRARRTLEWMEEGGGVKSPDQMGGLFEKL